jgi:hypothetical protein
MGVHLSHIALTMVPVRLCLTFIGLWHGTGKLSLLDVVVGKRGDRYQDVDVAVGIWVITERIVLYILVSWN